MVSQRLTLYLSFLPVSAGQRDEIQIPAVQVIHIEGHDPLEADGSLSPVMDSGCAHDDVFFLKDGIQKGDLDLCHSIFDGQLHRVYRVIVLRKSSRQSVQGEGTRIESVGEIAAVKGEAPIRILNLYGIDAEISLLLCGEFLRLRVQGKRTTRSSS